VTKSEDSVAVQDKEADSTEWGNALYHAHKVGNRTYINYKQEINGYRVNLTSYPYYRNKVYCNPADFEFIGNGKRFNVHLEKFYAEPFLRLDGFMSWGDFAKRDYWLPFLFKDVDFDGKKELLINTGEYYPMTGCYLNVYKIGENGAIRLEYPPFSENFFNSEAELDYKRKTITVLDAGTLRGCKAVYRRVSKVPKPKKDYPVMPPYCPAKDILDYYYNSTRGPFILEALYAFETEYVDSGVAELDYTYISKRGTITLMKIDTVKDWR